MKNILVTGATSGIGKAVAEYLASKEYTLMLVGRNQEKLIKLCTDLGNSTDYILCDFSQSKNIENIFKQCQDKEFRIDGLVHCAGIAGNMATRLLDMEELNRFMQVNCLSFVEMAKYATNRKYCNDEASIIAISSLSSVTCYKGTMAYSMSKSALNTACKVLSKETINRKIRVNAIMPGYVRTPMMGQTTDEDILSEQPYGFIEPIEIAYLVEFLLSDKSKHMTGSLIPVSGGMHF